VEIELTVEQKEDRVAFRTFVDEEIVPHADRYDQEECIPAELTAKLAQRGYLGATLPEEYGGPGMDMITYGLLCEELGRGYASVQSLVTVQNMVGQAILKWGSEHQKESWLDRLACGEVIAAFALTEPHVGSDARHVETTATLAGDSYVLRGRKKWISFGQVAGLFLVLGQCEGKPCAFLLEKDTQGLSMEPIHGMLGFRASMLAELHLDDCEIPEGNLVGGIGFGFFPVALFALNMGRYSVAWGCVGLAQACLEACIHYTSTRKQFGRYLRENQLVQHMIADMVVNVKAARLLCYQAGYLKEQGDPNSIMEVMVAKYFASTTATRTASDAVQIHGAKGCHDLCAVQRYLRDAKIMEIIEGTTQIHQIKIAEYGYQAYNNA
jgi:glutaryl-CoA dehydrogenase (non-decarboxylating)